VLECQSKVQEKLEYVEKICTHVGEIIEVHVILEIEMVD
jgi:hypothetical protein